MGLVGAAMDELRVQQLRSVLTNGDAAAGDLLPTYGNRFDLLERATPWIDRLVQDVGAAQHQFNFTTYAIQPSPEQGLMRRFLDVTTRRADEGLPVTAIVDELGSGMGIPGETRRVRRAFMEELRDHHVDVRTHRFSFRRGPLDDARFAVDHRKIYEIDGRVSYAGGMNLVDAWSDWHDFMLRAEGPTSAQAGALLAGRWRDLGGDVSAARQAILEDGLRAPVDDARFATWQVTNGNRHRRELTERFVDGVRGAQDRVWLANPYLSDPHSMSAVVDAAAAGRDVRLLLAPKASGTQQAQDLFTDPLRRAWAHAIAMRGGTIIRVPEFSHAKAWIIDQRANVGSHNLELGATRRNYENVVETEEPHAVDQVEALFQRQTLRGVQLEPGDIQDGRRLDAMRRTLHLQY
jgi:phosphatidylserine/phosphatidylglycerophosphate/cardiolipin synthase-like enzyme